MIIQYDYNIIIEGATIKLHEFIVPQSKVDHYDEKKYDKFTFYINKATSSFSHIQNAWYCLSSILQAWIKVTTKQRYLKQ